MAAYLGLVAHAAERHAHEFALGGARDGAPERGLAHSRRPYQAQDRAFHLLDALLHREIFQDALLDLVEAVMIFLKDLLGLADIPRDLAAPFPGHAHQPVHVIAHHRGLGRHGRHHPELAEFGLGLLSGLLVHARLGDLRGQLVKLVRGVLHLAELLLDGLHLLVQIVFALALFHLCLDAAADALFHAQQVDLGPHELDQVFQPRLDLDQFQHPLFFLDLDRHMGRNGIGQAAGVINARE